jgi:hypothetical protein
MPRVRQTAHAEAGKCCPGVGLVGADGGGVQEAHADPWEGRRPAPIAHAGLRGALPGWFWHARRPPAAAHGPTKAGRRLHRGAWGWGHPHARTGGQGQAVCCSAGDAARCAAKMPFSAKKSHFSGQNGHRADALLVPWGGIGRGRWEGVPGVHGGTLGGCSAGASPPRRAAARAAGVGFGAQGGHRRHSAGLLGLACDRTVGPRARTSRSHAWASRGGRLVAQLGMGCGSMQTAFGH